VRRTTIWSSSPAGLKISKSRVRSPTTRWWYCRVRLATGAVRWRIRARPFRHENRRQAAVSRITWQARHWTRTSARGWSRR
jgi:hypothetical protein